MEINDCPLVLVEWVDSQSDADWEVWEHIKEPKDLVVHTAGWLIKRTKQSILIAGSIVGGENKQANLFITVPLVAVNWIKSENKYIYKRK